MLLNKIDSLEEVLRQVLIESNGNLGNKLILTGIPSNQANLIGIVRLVLSEKLGLYHFHDHVLSVTPTEDGIVFEVRTVFDKKRILYRTLTGLVESKLQINDYPLTVSENKKQSPTSVRLDVRLGNDDESSVP